MSAVNTNPEMYSFARRYESVTRTLANKLTNVIDGKDREVDDETVVKASVLFTTALGERNSIHTPLAQRLLMDALGYKEPCEEFRAEVERYRRATRDLRVERELLVTQPSEFTWLRDVYRKVARQAGLYRRSHDIAQQRS